MKWSTWLKNRAQKSSEGEQKNGKGGREAGWKEPHNIWANVN